MNRALAVEDGFGFVETGGGREDEERLAVVRVRRFGDERELSDGSADRVYLGIERCETARAEIDEKDADERGAELRRRAVTTRERDDEMCDEYRQRRIDGDDVPRNSRARGRVGAEDERDEEQQNP